MGTSFVVVKFACGLLQILIQGFPCSPLRIKVSSFLSKNIKNNFGLLRELSSITMEYIRMCVATSEVI